MKIKIFNHGKSCFADAIYIDGRVTVKKGSRIFLASNANLTKNEKLLALRNDKTIVDSKGILLQDCTFKTPSAAAVFVAGSSRSGNTFWKVGDGVSLGKYLEDKE